MFDLKVCFVSGTSSQSVCVRAHGLLNMMIIMMMLEQITSCVCVCVSMHKHFHRVNNFDDELTVLEKERENINRQSPTG